MRRPEAYTGELTQRIKIMSHGKDVSDGAGGTEPKIDLYWSTAAKVTPMKSSNILQANQKRLLDGFKFVIRDRRDKTIHANLFIEYRGGKLEIISAIPDYVYSEFLVIKAVWSRVPRRFILSDPNDKFNYVFNYRFS